MSNIRLGIFGIIAAMKNLILALSFALALTPPTASAQDAGFASGEECPFDRFYAGAGAMLVLPEGGSQMRRLGGAAARAGCYLNEFWAVEAEAAALENFAGLSAAVLWHWWGYERFDPFFTFGAKGWLGHGDGQLGPKAGIGSFYHLTDSWSLRFDADATLGLDTETETVYSVSAGLQRSF